MIHDFKDKEVVYLMSGKRLMIGVITDEICGDDFKFTKIPLASRNYIPVKWNGKNGHGSPAYFSLYRTKKEALDNWKNIELEKINKVYNRYIK